VATPPIPDVPNEYIRPPEWVSVNVPGNPLVAKRMMNKVVAPRSQTTPAWVLDQPEP